MPNDIYNQPDYEIEEFDNDRCNEVYQQLISETENKSTIHNQEQNELLTKLLALMEYLRGDGSDNPIPDWFTIEYDEYS